MENNYEQIIYIDSDGVTYEENEIQDYYFEILNETSNIGYDETLKEITKITIKTIKFHGKGPEQLKLF